MLSVAGLSRLSTANRMMRVAAPSSTKVYTRAYSSGGPSLLELVKILRKDTKAGIADCRDALVRSISDLEYLLGRWPVTTMLRRPRSGSLREPRRPPPRRETEEPKKV